MDTHYHIFHQMIHLVVEKVQVEARYVKQGNIFRAVGISGLHYEF